MGTVGYDPGGWYLIHAGTSLLVITSQFVLRALAIETRYSYPSWLPQVRAYVRYDVRYITRECLSCPTQIRLITVQEVIERLFRSRRERLQNPVLLVSWH